ncbi:bifunctional phosphopantothenoylcysteine decarboxylase/phosphopantothenate--cysteine ligase CoaBC [Rhodocytophaga aerolata]|uniref:Coenzyme A biosynthesis bifunctional protein CoaBC n=1 Tax=Rhodocytophaga aerolata TaxID=455078 RepID=A0ABT8R211_9BACT|nr:bifunctional phosphopantothenoylcysteine decarboxylase/phosphopantothenate--cysteine ligase CoaBC [Rhodocytophaga aerolata]MDO1445343.1 bifunctional phosphopantothenoylcysteine decarboxylase/phosphopantothenate--cysteine ligase CoaBC [Rhodocytophaga aerolata]
MLAQKKILLCVSGSIAAYKAALLVRLLVKEQAEVKVILTTSASQFITPLTLATLSKNPVLTDFIKNDAGEWNNHVALGLWADAIVIAPASANTLAKCAQGICDNLLVATYLSARCPVFFAPAMDLDMYQHPSTIQNLQKLASFGNHIIAAEYGELASGLTGVGRMAEPEQILQILQRYFSPTQPLLHKKVLITAGPTYEAIDPVRFISNHSTGKMGYALAHSLAEAGAQVDLVSGPTHLQVKHPTINLLQVVSAQEMYEQSARHFSSADIIILAAAVADYTPAHKASQKIKKKETNFTLELTKTIDIAATLGKQKKPKQLLIGFALETNNELENAFGKLVNKNLDFIVLNSMNDAGAGFGHDTNKVTIIEKDHTIHEIPLKEKTAIAKDITNLLISKLQSANA